MKTLKAHPGGVLDSWKGNLKIHSSYGWTENKVKNWKAEVETFLSGYIKVDKADVDQFLSLSGRQAMLWTSWPRIKP